MADDFDGNDVRQTLEAWRQSANEATKQPDWYWTRQHAQVMSRIGAQANRTPIPKLAWASVAATIAIAVAMFLPTRSAQPVAPQTVATIQPEISDHELMLTIERSMNAGVPSSLAPATLLAEEMNRALESQIHSQNLKENRYEN